MKELLCSDNNEAGIAGRAISFLSGILGNIEQNRLPKIERVQAYAVEMMPVQYDIEVHYGNREFEAEEAVRALSRTAAYEQEIGRDSVRRYADMSSSGYS